MKKNECKSHVSIFSALLMVMLCFGFTSCSDDDDNGIDGDVNELIVGEWQSTWSTGYFNYRDNHEKWDEAFTNQFLLVKSNGKINKYSLESGGDRDEPLDWKISGTKVTVTGEDTNETYTILKLNSKEMVLEYGYNDELDGEEYYEKITFRRL